MLIPLAIIKGVYATISCEASIADLLQLQSETLEAELIN